MTGAPDRMESEAGRGGAGFRYAVIDMASAAALRPLAGALPPSAAEPLLARSAPRRLLMVGPWLVRLSKAPDVERAIEALPPRTPWGFYVHSTVDIVSLRSSLRRFNLAEIPDAARPVLFRYWDPRVMQVFLDVATRAQRARLFEWIERIEMADGRNETMPRN